MLVQGKLWGGNRSAYWEYHFLTEAEQLYPRPVNRQATLPYTQYLPHQQDQTLCWKQFIKLPRSSRGTTWWGNERQMGSRTSTWISNRFSYWQKPIPGMLVRVRKWWRWVDQLRRHQLWNSSRLLDKWQLFQHLQATKILQETQEASHSRNPQVNCSNWTRQSSRPQFWRSRPYLPCYQPCRRYL